VDCDEVLEVCRAMRGATEGFPFGETVLVFKVAGKMFAIVEPGHGRVSLKCDPGYAAALREQYAAVTAGYHLDKRHWNTVALDGSVPDPVLADWIEDSFELVLATLPKKHRDALER
jgi:predicted DNA-binding protein (MmcQ/YjbR family)